jgi:Tubulin domain
VIEQNDYQKNLDQGLPTSQLRTDQVRYWSDFNRVFYHPRSIVQLNEYELSSQLMPFENWNAGQELFHDLDEGFDLFDRDVRPFAEECDHLEGIQIFTSTDDAWGGFSSSYADVLRDEFGKSSIWLWGLENGLRVARVSCASE